MAPTEPFLHAALVEPEIAPNVGTIARLCAATSVRLHLIGKLGFQLTEKALRRAGLDYWPAVDLEQHVSWEAFREKYQGLRCVAFSARGRQVYHQFSFARNDCLVFGSETAGLPTSILQSLECVTIPMPSGQVRCLNVASSVSIGVYEALRQLGQLQPDLKP
jgi:tRNA (cytidine/uridine-2'-O-)-methyltransferase